MSPVRQVFFIGGFDPKSARHPHRVYRAAARAHPASAAGERITVGPLETDADGQASWTVSWLADGQPPLQTRYTVLRWDDVVRRHWARHLSQMLADVHETLLRPGALAIWGRLYRLGPGAVWLGALPVLLGLGCLGLGAATGLGAALAAGAVWPAMAGLAAGLGLWRLLERRLDTEWLLRLYAFTCGQGRGGLPDLEQRLDTWADAVAARLPALARPEVREVLVVGHSVGAILAVDLLARVLRRRPEWAQPAPGQPALGLLTLGHCTPLLALQPGAHAFRAAQQALADTPALTWWDFSAPADWAAFAQVPPWLRATGRARRHQQSPRFHQVMSPQAYSRLRANRQALHLHYLCAPERAGGYDPVLLTAGPLTLAQRHARLTAGTDVFASDA